MKILFDTHAFIWWDDDHTRLSAGALAACQNTENTLMLSIASIWEMQIKIQLGKLKFGLSLEEKSDSSRKPMGWKFCPSP